MSDESGEEEEIDWHSCTDDDDDDLFERVTSLPVKNGDDKNSASNFASGFASHNSERADPVRKQRNPRKFHSSQSPLFRTQHDILARSSHTLSLAEFPHADVQRTRRNLSGMEKLYDLFLQSRFLVGHFVNSPKMQFFVVYLIGINGIMMGLGTFDFVRENARVEHAFEVIDDFFLVLFTIELGMQLYYYGWRLLQDGWLVFDLVIITFSWAFDGLQIIRSFRIFRAFRLITRIKVLKNLVTALFSVIPRMFAIGILLGLLSYIFCVMFTQLFKNLYEEGYTEADYFGRMDLTFFTLFQIMTLDNWADIARQVMAAPHQGWAWLPFIAYVILTAFVVVNLVIAVICDAVSALEGDERAKLEGRFEEEEEEEDEFESGYKSESSSRKLVSQPLYITLQEQLDALEDSINELVKMQAESQKTLALLTLELQMHRADEVDDTSQHSSFHSSTHSSAHSSAPSSDTTDS